MFYSDIHWGPRLCHFVIRTPHLERCRINSKKESAAHEVDEVFKITFGASTFDIRMDAEHASAASGHPLLDAPVLSHKMSMKLHWKFLTFRTGFAELCNFPHAKISQKTWMKVGTGNSSFVTQRWGTTSSRAAVYPASLAWMTTFWFHMIITPSIEQHQKLESMMAVWTFMIPMIPCDQLHAGSLQSLQSLLCEEPQGEDSRTVSVSVVRWAVGTVVHNQKNWCASVAYCKLRVNHDQSTCDYRL